MVSFEPGVEVGGFVIESVAGRGGMGVVYRARQLRPDRVVALKVIAPDLAQDVTFRARFERESAIAAQIEHPNVIPVYAVGEEQGVLFLAMRFIDGVDLGALIAQAGRLEPHRAAGVIDQVAQALDAAHRRGLVHRDVKPANILISPEGGREHVYLTDFGLSRHVEGSQAMTRTGMLVGTIDYIAPEQVHGDRVDARTDVYSLGCVLFQALTGTVPYPRENEYAKLFAHGNAPPPSVRERAPDLPQAFDPVLARAMAKTPEQRYLSAGDLARAALAAASASSLSRAERSVATGAAAPGEVSAVAATPGALSPADEPTAQPVADVAAEPQPATTAAATAKSTGPPPVEADAVEAETRTAAQSELIEPQLVPEPEPAATTTPESEAATAAAEPETRLASSAPPRTAAAAPPAPPRSRVRFRLVAAALGLAIVGGIAAIVIMLTGGGPGALAPNQPPSKVGPYAQCSNTGPTEGADGFGACYELPGSSDYWTLGAKWVADVQSAEQELAAEISNDKAILRSPSVTTQTIRGVKYTTISGQQSGNPPVEVKTIQWQSGRVVFQLSAPDSATPAEMTSFATQAQAATNF
jgi:predicted Ser/Thr protein kinase